jgi:hypothetical protein
MVLPSNLILSTSMAPVTNNVLLVHAKLASSCNSPDVPANVRRVGVKSSTFNVAIVAEVSTSNEPLIVILPVVSCEPVTVNVDPLNVKFAESCNSPEVPANVTRPEVKSSTLTEANVD